MTFVPKISVHFETAISSLQQFSVLYLLSTVNADIARAELQCAVSASFIGLHLGPSVQGIIQGEMLFQNLRE
jgi:hypothetical protein